MKPKRPKRKTPSKWRQKMEDEEAQNPLKLAEKKDGFPEFGGLPSVPEKEEPQNIPIQAAINPPSAMDSLFMNPNSLSSDEDNFSKAMRDIIAILKSDIRGTTDLSFNEINQFAILKTMSKQFRITWLDDLIDNTLHFKLSKTRDGRKEFLEMINAAAGAKIAALEQKKDLLSGIKTALGRG